MIPKTIAVHVINKREILRMTAGRGSCSRQSIGSQGGTAQLDGGIRQEVSKIANIVNAAAATWVNELKSL